MAKWGAHETHKQSFLPFVLQHNSWNDPVENYPFGNIRIVAKYCLYHKKIASLCLWEKLYLNICMYMYTVTHFKLILKTGNDWIKSIFNCKKMVSEKLKNIFYDEYSIRLLYTTFISQRTKGLPSCSQFSHSRERRARTQAWRGSEFTRRKLPVLFKSRLNFFLKWNAQVL